MSERSKFSTVLERRTVLGILIVLSTSCTDPTRPVMSTGPAPAPAFPDLGRPAVVYVGEEGLYDMFAGYHASRLASRFVFFDDNTFELQFVGQRFGFFKYRGRVTRADGRFLFDWDGSSTAGSWGAIGTVRGDSLRVEYSLMMQMSDFIDGVYVRTPATP